MTTHAIRSRAVQMLDRLLPAPAGSPNYKENFWAGTPPPSGVCTGTNCNAFPPHYLFRLAGNKLVMGAIFPVPEALEKHAPHLRDAFVAPDGSRRPAPGDIFVLTNTTRLDRSIGHVGVVKNIEGSTWTTGDYGQKDGDGFCEGWDGKFVQRTYSKVGEVECLSGPGGTNPRAIWGWLDLTKIPGLG